MSAAGHHREEMSNPTLVFCVLTGQLLARATARFVEKAKTWDDKEHANTRPDPPRTGPYSELLIPRQQSLQALQDAIRYPPGTENLEAKQLEHREHMLRFFDTPRAIVIGSDDRGPNSVVSIGAVTQTICLAALTYGLGTCIMGIPVLWPETFRDLPGVRKDRAIVPSIAIGYTDLRAPINKFPRPREPLDNLVD